MSTPNKRQKKYDSQSSPLPAKSLDYFFNKQRQLQEQKQQQQSLAEPINDRPGRYDDVTTPVFSDEELARRLQEEWNKEDQAPPEATPAQSARHKKELVEEDGAAVLDKIEKHNLPLDLQSEKPITKAPEKSTLALQSNASTEDVLTTTIPFDESPLTFSPSKYLPELRAQWESLGYKASYGILTRAFILINSTTSRIKTVDTLVNFLRLIIEADPESLLPAVWLATNAISPPYISLELGLGGSAISKALKKVCGLDSIGLKALYDKHGDAGDVAFEAKKKQNFTLRKPQPLTITGVFQSLTKIASSKGTGSQEIKQRIVERLLQDVQSAEQSRYMVRTLCQHLRIGAVKTTMLIALSRAFLLSRPPDASFAVRTQQEFAKLKKEELVTVYSRSEETVKASFARRPNYNDLVPCLLETGVSEELLVYCGLGLHVPLRPMLGNITRDLGEMLTKLQGRDFSCEYKYDGQRAQVHCDETGRVSIFSRHLEIMTDKYPDLVALVPKIRGESVNSFILEGEVVAIDRQNGDLKAFQTLTNRARKDVDIGAVTIDVCLFSFDLMYLNGEPLLDRPFRERRELLRSLFIEIPNQFTWVKSIDATSADSETILEFFRNATDSKCEGIMVKVLDNASEAIVPEPQDDGANGTPSAATPKAKKATRKKSAEEKAEEKDRGARRKALLSSYEPDKRSDSWLKVKKDYNTSADTLDLIPIAGWHGQGRKAKWWSPILLAVRNPDTGSLEAVTKCISGFTDKFYQANKDKYAEDSINTIAKPSYVEYPGHPDVWFEPQEVWEMAFADITLSPTYLAAIGLVSEERGLSTRFPRFLRVREDKSIDEATTSEYLAALYGKQEARALANTPAAEVANGDDVDGDKRSHRS